MPMDVAGFERGSRSSAMRRMKLSVDEASNRADVLVVRQLFEEYAAGLDVDLCFQGFAEELAGLPGRYVGPLGGLWLARDDGAPVGCIALRRLDTDRCELKRLYVRSTCRGTGLGRRLVEVALARAVDAGYRHVCLDTLPSMTGAIALYRSMGFTQIEAYNDNPVAGTLFLERALTRGDTSDR